MLDATRGTVGVNDAWVRAEVGAWFLPGFMMADIEWQQAFWRRRLETVERLLEADDEGIADVTQFVEEMDQRVLEPGGPVDVGMGSLARGLAETYLRADPAVRAELRAVVKDYPRVLEELVSEGEFQKNKLASAADTHELRMALAMLALNDQQSDWREFLLALAALCDAGEKSGIAIIPILDELVTLSSATASAARPSTAQVFSEARDARAAGVRRQHKDDGKQEGDHDVVSVPVPKPL